MKIGIDLGTTTSTIVRLDPKGRHAQTVMIDSLGAWRNGQLHFGEDAYRALLDQSSPAFPVRDIKLSLGDKSIKAGGVSVDVEEIVSKLLKFLADKVAPGQVIEEAVIGTPVNVSEEHRHALLRCAEQAGFKNVRLVYEPTSALVGAIEPKTMLRHSSVLVVDWGGGTLDLSLIRKDGDCLREIAVDGDVSKLGGSQMDTRILQKILERTPGVKAQLVSISDGFNRLKVEIEKEKKNILESVNPETDDVEISPFWLGKTLALQGKDVVEVATEMAGDAANQILEFLGRAGLGVADVTHVLFAGGVCRSSLVRGKILDVLPDIEIIETSIPQQLTGYGCARLLSYGFELRLARDFGVRQSDNSFCRMLAAGHDIGLGTFRTADFMVTNPLASEAIFDFGIVPASNEGVGMLATSSDGFASLKVMYIRCQQREGQLEGGSYELVKVYSGISHALAVTVFAESNVGNASVKDSISGIPFLIRLNGLE